jgi:hypothetical protein
MSPASAAKAPGRIKPAPNYDRVEYAERVMADCPLVEGTLSIDNPRHLYAVPYLRRLTGLTVSTKGALVDPSLLAGHPRLETLTLSGVAGLRSLTDLAPLPQLRSLSISQVPELVDLDGVDGMPSLECLALVECEGIETLAPLVWAASLRGLAVSGPEVVELSPLADTALEDLSVSVRYVDDFDVTASLSTLTHVRLNGVTNDLSLFPLIHAAQLQTVALEECTGRIEIAAIGRERRPLPRLRVCACPDLMASLGGIGRVETLELGGRNACDLSALDTLRPRQLVLTTDTLQRLPSLPCSVEALSLHSPSLIDVGGLPISSLHRLSLDTKALGDLRAVGEAAELTELHLVALADTVDFAPLTSLAGRCAVYASHKHCSVLARMGLTVHPRQHWRHRVANGAG